MVSKVKKAPSTKSIRDVRGSRRWRRKSPIKSAVTASSAVISSIRRRITKLFSKIASLTTTPRKNRYKILKKTTAATNDDVLLSDITKTLFFEDDEKDNDNVLSNHTLPPQISDDRRTVFLDLDETLVHSKTWPKPGNFDFVVRPVIDGEAVEFYVLKRPGVDEFLAALAAKFEVVVFTAAVKEYASLVLDRLDRNRFVSHRLYRDSCRQVDGKLVKDLAETGRDLKRVVIVDDNPNSFSNQPENAILIKPFVDDLRDRELLKLRRFFDWTECYNDMRDAVKQYRSVQQQSSESTNLNKFLVL